VAPLVRTGGSRHTGLAAPPHRNIHITIFAIACAITGTGSGFLDLSNVARAVCIGIAIICGILAFITWKCSKSKA